MHFQLPALPLCEVPQSGSKFLDSVGVVRMIIVSISSAQRAVYVVMKKFAAARAPTIVATTAI